MSNLSALLDACVLLPFALSHTLLEIAGNGLYQVHFSNTILDEAIRNLIKGEMSQATADNLRKSWLKSFPEALVENAPLALEEKMDNDPKDRHVLAAAVYAKIDVIITCNLKDFPRSSIEPWNIEVMHPDDFLIYLCDEYGDESICDLISEMIDGYKKPPYSYLEFISRLEEQQPKFSSRMLIAIYGDLIYNIAKTTLITVTNVPKGQRSFDGDTYNIREDNNIILITKKNPKQEVFRVCNGEITGNIKSKDIKKFQEFMGSPDYQRISKTYQKVGSIH